MLYDVLQNGFSLPSLITYLLSSLIVIFLTLPFHEFAHGFAASKLGDPTARYLGRLSLNPMKHIDWMGAACILLFGFGWAKAVPVNTRYFKNPRRDMALTALAGPVANLVMALAALLLGNAVLAVFGQNVSFLSSIPIYYYIYYFFYYIALINVSLAVFNLIPIPPLDGSRLLSALLPYKYYYALMRYEKYLFYAVLVLVAVGALDKPMNAASGALMNALSTIASLPFRLLGVFA